MLFLGLGAMFYPSVFPIARALMKIFRCLRVFSVGYSHFRQGLWTGGKRTPPGPEGSNGSLTTFAVALWRIFFALSNVRDRGSPIFALPSPANALQSFDFRLPTSSMRRSLPQLMFTVLVLGVLLAA